MQKIASKLNKSFFTAQTFEFLESIADNNNKEWWQAHKTQFLEYVRNPLEFLAVELSVEYGQPHIYRPNRDVRFSKDKSPYKSFAAFWIPTGAVGYYLEINKARIMLGGGTYEPASDQLLKWRQLFDDKDKRLQAHKVIKQMQKAGFELLQENSLKSAPKGWKSDHLDIEFLRLKHLVVTKCYSRDEVLANSDYFETYKKDFESAQIWNKMLDKLVGGSKLERRK